jgi:hypothetical protein
MAVPPHIRARHLSSDPRTGRLHLARWDLLIWLLELCCGAWGREGRLDKGDGGYFVVRLWGGGRAGCSDFGGEKGVGIEWQER